MVSRMASMNRPDYDVVLFSRMSYELHLRKSEHLTDSIRQTYDMMELCLDGARELNFTISCTASGVIANAHALSVRLQCSDSEKISQLCIWLRIELNIPEALRHSFPCNLT